MRNKKKVKEDPTGQESDRTARCPAEDRTQDLSNISLRLYHLSFQVFFNFPYCFDKLLSKIDSHSASLRKC